MRIQNVIPSLSRDDLFRYFNSVILADNYEFVYNDFKTKGSSMTTNGQEDVTEELLHFVFLNCLYDFTNNNLGEVEAVTESKISIVKKIVEVKNNQIQEFRRNLSLYDFFEKFINNELDEYLDYNFSIDLKINYANLLIENIPKYEFTFRFKDSNNVTFIETSKCNPYSVLQNYGFDLALYLNDQTTYSKNGFNSGENIYAYYYNPYYNKEYPIVFKNSSGNIINAVATNRFEYFIRKIEIDEDYNIDLNPKYLKVRSNEFNY